MTGAQRRTQERDELRAGMGWALVRAFERFRATDEHLHTAAWFLDRHVGFDVALEDFASARGAHQGPFSETFARTVTSLQADGGPLTRDAWGRLHLTDRRMTVSAGLSDAWLTLRPAAALLTHHIGGLPSADLGRFVAVTQGLVEGARPAELSGRSDMERLAIRVLEQRVPLGLAGRREAQIVRQACVAGGATRGRAAQLAARGLTSQQIAHAMLRTPADVRDDLWEMFTPLVAGYRHHVALLAAIAPASPDHHRPVGAPPLPCEHGPDVASVIADGRDDRHMPTCRDCTIEASFYRLCLAVVLAPWAWPVRAGTMRLA